MLKSRSATPPIARIIYPMLTHRTPFHDLSPEEHSRRIRTRETTGPCTCPLRINTPGSSADRQKTKKVYPRGSSWPPSGPPTPGDALDAGRADARRLLRSPPLAASHHPAGSHPCWLRPRRHAEQEHLAQRPDMVGQSRRHGWCLEPPAFGGAAAVGRLGLGQELTEASMRQAEVIVAMVKSELMAQPLLAFAQRGDSPSDRRHMLTDGEVEAFNEGRVDLPAAGREYLLDGLQGPEDHPVAHPHQAPPAYRLDHLRIEQPGQRHPA